jgi:hypothetical protein
MNPDLLCPDIVQILAWSISDPEAVTPHLAALGDPEVLFSSESTLTALGGLLSRAPVEDVCRVVRCPATARRVRWMASMHAAEVTRRARLEQAPSEPPTPDEVAACVTRALRWQADAVDYATDAIEAGASLSEGLAFGALTVRREQIEGRQW